MLICQTCFKTELENVKFGKNRWKKSGYQGYCDDCRKKRSQRDWALRIVVASRTKDQKLNRFNPINYITEIWILNTLKLQYDMCYWCTAIMDYGANIDRNNRDALTIDRLDNNIGHQQLNCVLACHECNMRHKNIPNEIMKIHGPNFKEGFMKYCPGKSHEGLLAMERVLYKDEFCADSRSYQNLGQICRACKVLSR